MFMRGSLTIYFDFYKKKFFGQFEKSEISAYFNRAESYINNITLGKSDNIKKGDAEYNPIMMCVCEIADILCGYDNGDLLKSESVDNEHYERVPKGGSLDEIIYSVCRRHLLTTGLLYAGVVAK